MRLASNSHLAAKHPSSTDLDGSSSRVHRYSCTTCRERKVKCNKLLSGCKHCKKANSECIYTRRRPRVPTKELHDLTATRPLRPDLATETSKDDTAHSTMVTGQVDSDTYDTEDDEDLLIPHEMRDASFRTLTDQEQNQRDLLFVSQGKSRYVNFSKAQKLSDVDQLLAERSYGDGEIIGGRPIIQSAHRVSERRFDLADRLLTNSSVPTTKIPMYHPTGAIIGALWRHYTLHVDILVKIIYKPIMEAYINTACTEPRKLSSSEEILLFAIYLTSVSTMTADECTKIHGEVASIVVVRYADALEQCFYREGWMTTQKMMVLQALALLLVISRGKSSRSRWTLTGIAIGIAQSMGMHRDSTSFGLGSIDAEIRRRVWWITCMLDHRISNDCGLEDHVPLTMDTRLPLHVDDVDLANEQHQQVVPKNTFTEMTVTLVKVEMIKIFLEIKFQQYKTGLMSLQGMEVLVQTQITRYHDTYLSYFDRSIQVQELCYLGTQFIIAKLWKLIYDQSRADGSPQSEETQEKLLMCNTNIVKYTQHLPDYNARYGWFFGSSKYNQWFAMVYLLFQLRHANPSPMVAHAWEVLDSALSIIDNRSNDKDSTWIEKSVLWHPLQVLLKRARDARDHTSVSSKVTEGNELMQTQLDFDYDTRDTGPVSHESGTTQFEDHNLNDPYMGSMQDMSDDIDWAQFDTLMERFRSECDERTLDPSADSVDGIVPSIWW